MGWQALLGSGTVWREQSRTSLEGERTRFFPTLPKRLFEPKLTQAGMVRPAVIELLEFSPKSYRLLSAG